MAFEAARILVAAVLIAASGLKILGWTSTGAADTLEVIAILVEIALAGAFLLCDRARVRLTLYVALLLSAATAVRAVIRAAGPNGLEGNCGCLGPLISMRVWHQLVLSGSLLLVFGLMCFLIDSATARHVRGR